MAEFIELLKAGGPVVAAVLMAWLVREILTGTRIVLRRELRREEQIRMEAEVDRDEWKQVALEGLNLAGRSVDAAERVVRASPGTEKR